MNTKHLFLAAAATMMLAACSNESENNAQQGQIRLTTADMQVTTRSTSQALLATQFDNGDQIDVFIKDAVDQETTQSEQVYTQPLVYTADGSGNLTTTTAQYWPPYKRSISIWGVYPKGMAGTNVESVNIEFSIKEDQSSAANYKASDLMTGTAANPVAQLETLQEIPLTFKHLLSKVNVNLSKTEATTDITDAMLASAEIYILSTKPTTKFTPKSYIIDKNDASGTAFTNGIHVCTGITGSCIVVPQDMTAGDNFIKVLIGNDTFLYKVPAGGISFEPQKLHTFNIKIHKANIIVTSTITAWTETTANDGTAILQNP